MSEGAAPIEALQRAIKDLHGLDAIYRESVWVVETFRGSPVWGGDVSVFDVKAPSATSCYAWAAPTSTAGRDELVAVLGEGAIRAPEDAVRAWIASKARQAGQRPM